MSAQIFTHNSWHLSEAMEEGGEREEGDRGGGTRTDRRKDFTEGEVLDGRELGEGGGSCRDEERKSETLQFFFPPQKKTLSVAPSFISAVTSCSSG